MSEKTAEEKLRQALEGSTASTSDSEQPKNQKKPRPSRARPKPSRTAKAANLGERLDSFMDDFERRIEQSISAVKSPSETPEHHEKPGRVKISAEHKPETSRRVRARPKDHHAPLHEPVPEIPQPEILSTVEPQPVQEVSQPEILPTVEPEPVQEVPQPEILPTVEAQTVQEISQPEILPTPEPEPVQEVPQPEVLPAPEIESAQEEIIPDVMPIEEEYEPAEDLPDIPVIEAAEISQNEEGNLPDIPLISADDANDDIDDAAEIFADELEEMSASADNDIHDDNEISGHEEETDAPDEESQIEFQEAELQEAQYDEDEFADIDTEDNSDVFTDEPLDEEPAIIDSEEEAEDAPPYDVESDEDGIFADDTDETPGDFSPSADVVLNVDDEIPQISPPAETENDPEAESAPVTVTMPESTRTAEDKLMADIAEAMTGNPLSLDSQETNGIYNLPENFFTDGANNGDSPQSAEDKLKANIVQALSESPINAAHENASQSLEQDINPFEELSIPETLTHSENESHEEDLSSEETNDEPEILTEENNDDLFPESSAEESTPEESPSQDFDDIAGEESTYLSEHPST